MWQPLTDRAVYAHEQAKQQWSGNWADMCNQWLSWACVLQLPARYAARAAPRSLSSKHSSHLCTCAGGQGNWQRNATG